MTSSPPEDSDSTASFSGDEPASTPRSVWSTLREAVRGSSIDYTTAPVGRAILMLAVPMIMEMAMESIFVLADVFWWRSSAPTPSPPWA